MSQIEVKIKLKEGAIAPSYAHTGDAGMDLHAFIDLVLDPGKWDSVPTGVSIELPDGCEAQVRPRSGLASRQGVTVLNAPGTIDAGYRGELCVLLINHGSEPYCIKRGDRIAQLVIAPVLEVRWKHASVLDDTERGTGGFGSTGS